MNFVAGKGGEGTFRHTYLQERLVAITDFLTFFLQAIKREKLTKLY